MKLHQCRPHNFYRAFGSKLVVSVEPHNPFVNNTNLCYPLKIEMRHFRSLDVISVHEMAVALPSNKDTTTRLKFRKLLIPAKWWKYQSDQNLKWIDHQTRIERRIDCTQKRVDFYGRLRRVVTKTECGNDGPCYRSDRSADYLAEEKVATLPLAYFFWSLTIK